MTTHAKESHYRIVVFGNITEPIGATFPSLDVVHEAGRSIVTGAVRDQSHLHGILAVIRDLNVPLLAITCLNCAASQQT